MVLGFFTVMRSEHRPTRSDADGLMRDEHSERMNEMPMFGFYMTGWQVYWHLHISCIVLLEWYCRETFSAFRRNR